MSIIVFKATLQSGCELKCETFIVRVVSFLHTYNLPKIPIKHESSL
jgi:hypothetical protein